MSAPASRSSSRATTSSCSTTPARTIAAEKPMRVVVVSRRGARRVGRRPVRRRRRPRPTQRLPIDHVVLSHPHLDHGSALDLVVHCYDVKNVWDSGRDQRRRVLSRLPRRPSARRDRALPHRRERARRPLVGRQGHRDQDPATGSGSPRAMSSSSAKARSSRSSTPKAKKLPDPNQNSVVIAVDARRRRGCCSSAMPSRATAQDPSVSGRRRRGVPDRAARRGDPRRHPPGRPSRLEDVEPARFLEAVKPAARARVDVAPSATARSRCPTPR